MILTKREGREVVYGDDEDWETVVTEIIEHSRWTVMHEGVFKHKPTNKFYRLYWSVGATEQQDEQAFEYDDPNPIEVIEKQVMKTEWVKLEENETDG